MLPCDAVVVAAWKFRLRSASRRRRWVRRSGVALVVAITAAVATAASTLALVGDGGRFWSYGSGAFRGPDASSSGRGPWSLSEVNTVLPPVAWCVQDRHSVMVACPVLVTLTVLTVVCFVFQHVFGTCIPLARISLFYPPTLKAFELWRLFSHVFLHSDIGHLISNVVHLLNTLDLEGVPAGAVYPSVYAIGSRHVAAVAATSAGFSALAGSVPYFGAIFEGASALCFGLDGALVATCGLLLGAQVGGPSLKGFLQARGLFTLMHMGIDVLRGCGNRGSTVGNFVHLAGFVAGFCYVIVVMPLIGGRPAPTVSCLMPTSGDWRRGECLAFFHTNCRLPVAQAQLVATGVLLAGPVLAFTHAFVIRRDAHASADGISVLVKVPLRRPVLSVPREG